MSSSLSILGETKKLNYDSDREIVLRDPFLGSMQDLVRYCLNELSKSLHLTVSYTYTKYTDEKKQQHFFLTGYGERKDWNTLRRKLYGNPAICPEGKDLKWLLKNFRWNYRKYSLYLNIYEDTFDDITGFFLYDVSQALYTADPFDCDTELVSDCFDAALEIVEAISESKYYLDIQEKVLRHKENLQSMLRTISERGLLEEKHTNQQKTENLDTDAVLNFLSNKSLIDSLKKEAKVISENPLDKPLTNFFLHSVIARFQSDELAGDSGIVDDVVSSSSSLETPKHKAHTSSRMEGSMVIINSLPNTPVNNQSTPINKPASLKPLNVLLGSVANGKRYSNKDATKNVLGAADKMDGSFVLL